VKKQKLIGSESR